MVVGHCCESGDLLTPSADDPTNEAIGVCTLPADTAVGDLLVVGGAGAYCSSMSAKNYNSFPEAPEVLVADDDDGGGGGSDMRMGLIRRRQTLAQVIENEVEPVFAPKTPGGQGQGHFFR